MNNDDDFDVLKNFLIIMFALMLVVWVGLVSPSTMAWVTGIPTALFAIHVLFLSEEERNERPKSQMDPLMAIAPVVLAIMTMVFGYWSMTIK